MECSESVRLNDTSDIATLFAYNYALVLALGMCLFDSIATALNDFLL